MLVDLCLPPTSVSSGGLVNVLGPGCQFFLVKEFSVLNLRPNVYQELFFYDRQILGQERNLVHRSVLCSKFLSLSRSGILYITC